MPVDFAIGSDDFSDVITNKNTYIDKTLLIQEIIQDSSRIILFPRPRRFGKTLNMTMLKYFLDIRDKNSKALFEGLAVSQNPKIMAYQGKYPVIFLSLKDLKAENMIAAEEDLGKKICQLFSEHRYIQESLYPDEQEYFEKILRKKGSPSDLKFSLQTLSQWLEKYHQQKVWILIDEYDTPIHEAWNKGYYDSMKSFMQVFLGAALKSNPAVYRGVLTGILRISKEGMFSDLNNITVYSMLSDFYGSYFGFTEQEVDWVCEEAGLKNQREQVRAWYNGYQFGNLNIYNPWSIINFAKNKKLEPYWVNTGSNQIIEDLIAKSSGDFKFDFEALIQGRSITKPINEKISLPEIHNRSEEAIWSFLLFSGYLKIMSVDHESANHQCQIALPNIEITQVYQNYFLSWLNKSDSKKVLIKH